MTISEHVCHNNDSACHCLLPPEPLVPTVTVDGEVITLLTLLALEEETKIVAPNNGEIIIVSISVFYYWREGWMIQK